MTPWRASKNARAATCRRHVRHVLDFLAYRVIWPPDAPKRFVYIQNTLAYHLRPRAHAWNPKMAPPAQRAPQLVHGAQRSTPTSSFHAESHVNQSIKPTCRPPAIHAASQGVSPACLITSPAASKRLHFRLPPHTAPSAPSPENRFLAAGAKRPTSPRLSAARPGRVLQSAAGHPWNSFTSYRLPSQEDHAKMIHQSNPRQTRNLYTLDTSPHCSQCTPESTFWPPALRAL